jgi:hypothetical protein
MDRTETQRVKSARAYNRRRYLALECKRAPTKSWCTCVRIPCLEFQERLELNRSFATTK